MQPFPRCLLVMLLTVPALLTGCGTQTYNERLEHTKKYFEFREQVEKALVSSRGGFDGAQFRVPEGFEPLSKEAAPDADNGQAAAGGADPETLVLAGALAGQVQDDGNGELFPPGQAPAANEGDEVPPEEPLPDEEEGPLELPGDDEFDARQPDYIDLRLPGLVGAWRKKYNVTLENGDQVDRYGYIYLMTNHSLIDAARKARAVAAEQEQAGPGVDAVDPNAFFRFLDDRLSYAFNTSFEGEWLERPIPNSERDYARFLKRRMFEVREFPPVTFDEVDDVPLDITVYRVTGGSKDRIQGAVMFVIPSDRSSSLSRAIEFSLLSLRLIDTVAGGKQKSGGTAF